MVHGLHPLSAGDLPGPPGSPPQLPDHDHGSDGDGARERFASRRRHGCRRSDDHVPSRQQGVRKRLFRLEPLSAPRPSTSYGPGAAPLGIDVVVGDEAADLAAADVFGALLQYPDVTGAIPDYTAIIAGIHARDALAVVAADLLSLVLLRPAGGIRRGRRGGQLAALRGAARLRRVPHAAFLATRDDYRRTIPGRIVGQSVDARGRPAHRLALQTREQHIRREKATSNICTAQVLLAVIAGMYAVWHGPDGLRAIAGRVHGYASILAEGLRELGLAVRNQTFFDTLSVLAPGRAEAIVKRARESGVNLRPIDADTVGHLRGRDDIPRRRRCRAGGVCRRRRGRRRISTRSTAAPVPESRRPARGPRPFSATRYSTAIARRPRCSAISPACRRRTSRSTGP